MPHTILLADDSKTIRRSIEIAFEKEPFTLVAVEDGAAAVAKAKELQPSAVLADHLMPNQDGYDVASALKADPATANIPVLLLSGSAAPFDEGRCSSSGAVGHLQKPFDCQSLIDKVTELVGGVSDADREAAAAATPAVSTAASNLPKPPGMGSPRPPSGASAPSPMGNTGVTSAPIGTASPLAGARDESIDIDLGGPAARPTPAPASFPAATPAPTPAPASIASAAAPAVSAGLAAAGVPSTEAVTAATREIIEKVVWEVVPELAETLIKEEIERLLKAG